MASPAGEDDILTGGEEKMEVVEAWNEIFPEHEKQIRHLVWEDVATTLAEQLISPEDIRAYNAKQCNFLANQIKEELRLSIKAGIELVGLLTKINQDEGNLPFLLLGCTYSAYFKQPAVVRCTMQSLYVHCRNRARSSTPPS